MKNYEAYLLYSPKLDDSSVDKAVKEFENLLHKHNAKVTDVNKKGRQPMAYEIANFKDANHVLVYFDAEGDAIAPIKKQLEINTNVLRASIFVAENLVAAAK